MIRKINDIKEGPGTKCFLRVDWNVPFSKGKVTDVSRIEASLATIKFLLNRDLKIIIATHFDTETGLTDEKLLDFVKTNYFPHLTLAKSFHPDDVGHALRLSKSSMTILPNLRSDDREKKNDKSFAMQCATFADIYINECFSVSHREHMSIVTLPRILPSYIGLNCEREVTELSKAERPDHPALFLLGGLKYSTKAPLIEKFEKIYDTVYVAGAIAHVFFKARGLSVGRSAVEDVSFEELNLTSNNVRFSKDAILEDEKGKTRIGDVEDIKSFESAMDAGPRTIEEIENIIMNARFIVWNGPLGDYTKGYNIATKRVAETIIKSGAFSVVGGGDTIASIPKDILSRFSFVSTGGGAMLDFLANGTLPGIEVLKENI